LRGKRPQDATFESSLSVDKDHLLPQLRHWPLAKNFARDDRFAPGFRHEREEGTKHEHPAIHAGIEIAPPPESRVPHRRNEVLSCFHNSGFYAQLAGNETDRVPASTSPRMEEMDGQHFNALFLNDPGGKDAVQSTGNKSQHAVRHSSPQKRTVEHGLNVTRRQSCYQHGTDYADAASSAEDTRRTRFFCFSCARSFRTVSACAFCSLSLAFTRLILRFL